MSRNAKILIDLAVLAAVYGIWLLPKWRPLGRRTLAVYTLMYEFVPKAEAGKIVDLSKLPEDASETLRIVRIGDYDTCACIGAHVNNTSEIGHFKMLTYDYTDGRLRLRFKLTER